MGEFEREGIQSVAGGKWGKKMEWTNREGKKISRCQEKIKGNGANKQ